MLINKVRVGVIEDNDLIRKILSSYFGLHAKPLFELAFERSSLSGIEESWELQTRPQVILLDIDIPGVKGSDGIPLLMNFFPDASIIMFTSVEDEAVILKCIMAGARGYLRKDTKVLELTGNMLSIVKGETCISRCFNLALIDYLLSKTDLFDQLSLNEKYIIRTIIEGGSLRSISHHLQISISSVQRGVATIYRALKIERLNDGFAWLRNQKFSILNE